MAYDEGVAQRIREVLEDRPCIAEKKMFGGIAFMHSGKMCCGVLGEVLKTGVGPSAYADALSRPYTREMDFTGRPMKGFVYVDPRGFDQDGQLREWIDLCLAFTGFLPSK
jgi:hypothetical protein